MDRGESGIETSDDDDSPRSRARILGNKIPRIFSYTSEGRDENIGGPPSASAPWIIVFLPAAARTTTLLRNYNAAVYTNELAFSVVIYSRPPRN